MPYPFREINKKGYGEAANRTENRGNLVFHPDRNENILPRNSLHTQSLAQFLPLLGTHFGRHFSNTDIRTILLSSQELKDCKYFTVSYNSQSSTTSRISIKREHF